MKRTTAVISFSAMILLASIVAVGNTVAFANGGVIDLYLSNSSINYDSEEAQQALTLGKNLAQEICENGDVLLKNNGTLPLTTEDNTFKVNIFGWGGSDNGFMYQGGGSSEGGYSGDKVSLYQAFRNQGFEINEDLANAALEFLKHFFEEKTNKSLDVPIYPCIIEFLKELTDGPQQFSEKAEYLISTYHLDIDS